MKEQINKKTGAEILNALKKMQEVINNIKVKQEEGLFKKIDIPCKLIDLLNALKKNELDEIRKNVGFRNLSSLKKSELSYELSTLIPLYYKEIIYMLDKSIYDLIKLIVKNSGVIPSAGFNITKIKILMNNGIIFLGLHNGERVIVMPEELIKLFNEFDNTELEKIINRNTEWIQTTQGLLYYYGVCDIKGIISKVEKLTENKVNINEFMEVISFACDYYGKIQITYSGLADSRIIDTRKIVAEQNRRPYVEFREFTKNQLLKAGKPGYINYIPEMKSFLDFLSTNYNLSKDEADEIAIKLTDKINMDFNPSQLIQYFESMFEVPSFEFVQVFTSLLFELYNKIPQWVLKGHSPNELFIEKNKQFNNLPYEELNKIQPKAEIIDLFSGKKVGRNDPCPCGSGKKYKKCCGK